MKPFDPRFYQITVLTALLAIGLTQLQFEVRLPQVIVTFAAALATQAVAARLAGLPDPGLSSALISGLSLCLLLRTDAPWPGRRSPRSIAIGASSCCASAASTSSTRRTSRIVALLLADDAGLGLARPVGQRRVLRVPGRVPRQASWCTAPRAAT